MGTISQKKTLVDTIYDRIKKDITQHFLVPGQKINIKELSERYNASETPIKLALNRLISERIVENFPRQGMRVQLANASEIEEIFDIRLMLDLYFTKEIITTVNYNVELQTELVKNVDEHLALVEGLTPNSPVEDYMRNYALDFEFHELFLKCSGNRKIVDVFNFVNPFSYSNYIFRRQSKEKDVSGVIEHQNIVKALLSGDEDQLREALTIHNRNGKRAVSLILKVDKML